MAKTQVRNGSIGRVQRLLGWLARHKIRTGFAALFIGLALYLGGSWVVLQVQIHFERERFNNLRVQLSKTVPELSGIGTVHSLNYCYYNDSPLEFTRGSRDCVVRITLTQVSASRTSAKNSTLRAEGILQKVSNLTASKSSETNNLASDNFDNNTFACTFDSEYYGQNVPPSDRPALAPQVGSTLWIDIICQDSAKAEYFPVDKS